jgi:AcrR family transcriptional regulator
MTMEVVVDESLKPAEGRGSRAPVQKRGQQRVETILDAAEAVIGEVGVEAATTNAIAERAGSSVGSLYHFFPNKDAILQALTERYLETSAAILRRERRIDEPWVPLEVLFPQMIVAFVAMDTLHPGYMAVCRATDAASGGRSPIALRMEAHMEDMIEELLYQRCPGMPTNEAKVLAALSCVTVHSVLDHASSVDEPLKSGLRASLVEMMVNYFTPIEAKYPRPTGA